MVYRPHVQEGITTKNLQHSQNTQDQVIHAAKLAVLARLHLIEWLVIPTPPLLAPLNHWHAHPTYKGHCCS